METLYSKKDLNYKVEKELIYNDKDLLLLSDWIESLGSKAYQVIYNGGIQLNTFNEKEAISLFETYSKELLKDLLVIE